MEDSGYESTETIHLKISDIHKQGSEDAQRIRDEILETTQTGRIFDPIFVQLLESVYDAVLLTHLHGRVVRSNTRACDFFNIETADFNDHNIVDLIAGATFEHLETIYKTLCGERRLFIEAECIRADDSRFPAEITVSLLQVSDDEQLCFFIRNITNRIETEEALRSAQKELVSTAHRAGMAEIATGVLHDVGNLLNSVNVSAEIIRDCANSEAQGAMELLGGLLEENAHDLPGFFANDERGAQIPGFISQIRETLQHDLQQLQEEAIHLRNKISTINDAITTQQQYAKTGLFMEEVNLPLVIEDAISLQKGSITRHDMTIIKNFNQIPTIRVQKSKLIHALVNIITNAKDAMTLTPANKRTLEIELGSDEGSVYCRITDNGEGISEENLEKIFTHGFSTKTTGHGFGLHSSANFMAEMGGQMIAESDGIGKGATFTLLFPLNKEQEVNHG